MKGIYSLVIKMNGQSTAKVGKLGEIRFFPGYYVYTGSALGNLQVRIARHLKERKKLRWHIDYLLASSKAEIEQIVTKPTTKRLECFINKKIGRFGKVVSGFGSSDCKCSSHLYYFESLDRVRKALQLAFKL